MCWWIDLGYPSFQEGKGGFPRTGYVIKHYREKKRDDNGDVWTQNRLAYALNITDKSVGDMENKEVRVDMNRRRYLCELFAVPPLLLGIRTREEILTIVEEERAKQTASVASSAPPASVSWWVSLGYPEFAKGVDGFPHTGQVVKHYRKQKMDKKGKPWTQRLLALSLGITEQAVRDMENRGSGMDILDRRQFLSELLAIPPILLGIRTLEEMHQMVEEQRKEQQVVEPETCSIASVAIRTAHKLGIDTQEYTALLTDDWTVFISNPVTCSVRNVLVRIDALYRELPHTREKKPIQELLCRYHGLVANILRDRQQYDDAIEQCTRAFRFAKLLNSDELQALTLYEWGYTFWQADRLDEAVQKFAEARKYEHLLPANLRGVLLLDTGRAGAQAAQTKDERREAIALVDRVGTIVRNNHKEDDPYFLNLNLDRYHLTRSAAFIAVGKNEDALDELRLVKVGPEYPRRQACNDIYQAQAHINLGEYEGVAELAESGLEIAQRIDSEILITRIEKISQQLKESPYNESPEVARLSFLLRKRRSKK